MRPTKIGSLSGGPSKIPIGFRLGEKNFALPHALTGESYAERTQTRSKTPYFWSFVTKLEQSSVMSNKTTLVYKLRLS
jgi:hypothetical protein